YTQAERAILEKGQSSWKDELRKAINVVKSRNSDFESFQSDLASFGIETKKRGSTVSYLHPDVNKWVRAKRLGVDYELGGLENEFRRFNQSREITSEWSELKQDTEKRRNRRIEQEDRLTAEKDERRRLREERERESIIKFSDLENEFSNTSHELEEFQERMQRTNKFFYPTLYGAFIAIVGFIVLFLLEGIIGSLFGDSYYPMIPTKVEQSTGFNTFMWYLAYLAPYAVITITILAILKLFIKKGRNYL